MQEVCRMEFKNEISALCFARSSDLDFVYVGLYDAPYYSLNILSFANETLTLIARMPLSVMLELSQMKKFCQMQMIRRGQAFTKFNHESPSK